MKYKEIIVQIGVLAFDRMTGKNKNKKKSELEIGGGYK
jgi:hypothetical protein